MVTTKACALHYSKDRVTCPPDITDTSHTSNSSLLGLHLIVTFLIYRHSCAVIGRTEVKM